MKGRSELHTLCNTRWPDFERIKFILETTPQMVNQRDSEGCTPIFHAAYHGHTELVKALLDAGAEAHVKSKRGGTTPLHFAVYNGRSECVKLLLQHGAHPNEPNNEHKRTPVHIACLIDSCDCVKFLLRHGGDVLVKDLSNQSPLDYVESGFLLTELMHKWVESNELPLRFPLSS